MFSHHPKSTHWLMFIEILFHCVPSWAQRSVSFLKTGYHWGSCLVTVRNHRQGKIYEIYQISNCVNKGSRFLWTHFLKQMSLRKERDLPPSVLWFSWHCCKHVFLWPTCSEEVKHFVSFPTVAFTPKDSMIWLNTRVLHLKWSHILHADAN